MTGVDSGSPRAETFLWRRLFRNGGQTSDPLLFRASVAWPPAPRKGRRRRGAEVYATIIVKRLVPLRDIAGQRLHTGRTNQALHSWEMDKQSKRETIRARALPVKLARRRSAFVR